MDEESVLFRNRVSMTIIWFSVESEERLMLMNGMYRRGDYTMIPSKVCEYVTY